MSAMARTGFMRIGPWTRRPENRCRESWQRSICADATDSNTPEEEGIHPTNAETSPVEIHELGLLGARLTALYVGPFRYERLPRSVRHGANRSCRHRDHPIRASAGFGPTRR